MSKKTAISIIATGIIILSVLLPNRQDHEDHSMHSEQMGKSQIIEWTPSIHSALVKEMQAITVNYQNLVSALAQGDWKIVAENSHAIYSSFILKQELSQEDMEDLHRILPERFIEMDAKFHDHAKKLAMAAKNHDPELAAIYSGKLMEGCVNCHQSYANKRFPGFAEEKKSEHSH